MKLIGSLILGSIFLISVNSSSAETSTSTFIHLPQSTISEFERCGVDNVEFDRQLSLSQKDFDQDFTGGWRAIDYKDGCNNAAGELIKAYMLYSAPHPPKQMRILRWHAGQTKASAGQIGEAIALFAGSYNPDPERGTEWNLYVDATIAFLQKDKAALQHAHDTLAATTVSENTKEQRRKFLNDNPNITMPKGFVDEPLNLSPVRDLLNCFDRPYSEAYGKCGAK